MPDLETADEHRLLRSIGRRRMACGLAIMVPMLVAWWLLSRWIAQRWGLQPDLVRFAALLAFSVLGFLSPRWPGSRLTRDARETPRLRWLMQERADRHMALSRMFLVLGLGGLLLVQCVTLLLPIHADTAFSSSDGIVWAVLTGSLCLRWRPKDLGDEGAQLRYLTAVNHAFLVTMVACLGAIVMDALRGGLLRPALEAALLAGGLTLQLSLIIGERRTAQDGE